MGSFEGKGPERTAVRDGRRAPLEASFRLGRLQDASMLASSTILYILMLISLPSAAIAFATGRRHAVAGLLALACAAGAAGAPAPWYQWRSLQNGSQVCAQTSPGSGWAQAGGPFRDADCRRPLRVIGL